MNRTKILHVVAQEPVGGVGTYIKSIGSVLIPFGYEMSILESSDKLDGNFNKSISQQYTIYKIGKINILHLIKYYKKAEMFYQKNSENIDIVHLHAPNLAFIHLRLAKKYKIKTRIFQIHSTKLSSSLLKSFRNWLLIKISEKYVTDYAATSEESAIALEKIVHQHVNVLTNSIDFMSYKYDQSYRTKWRKQLEVSDQEMLIGMVGSLIVGKNQEYIINLISRLQNRKNVKLAIVGEGINRLKLEKIIKTNSLENKVIMMGQIKETNELYSAFDLFVQPSEFEGFSRVVLESQINGLQCLVSKGIPKSVVFDSKRVEFIDLDDPQAWLNNLNSLNLEELQKIHSENMENKFESSKFNTNKVQKTLLDYYRMTSKKDGTR